MNALNIVTAMVVLALVGCNKAESDALKSANKDLQSANKELESANKELESANTSLQEEVTSLKVKLEKNFVAKAEYDARLEELKAESEKVETATSSLVAAQGEIEKLRKEKEKLIAEVASAKTKVAETELAALKAKVEAEKIPQAFQNQLLETIKKGSRLVSSTEIPKRMKKEGLILECDEATAEFSGSLETTLTLWPKEFAPQAKVKFQSFVGAYRDWDNFKKTVSFFIVENAHRGGANDASAAEGPIAEANDLFRQARKEVLSKLK